MSGLVDIAHYYGNDIAFSNSADLAGVSGLVRSQQRILRRLLTNPALFTSSGSATLPPDYTWQPSYGAGVSRYVGQPVVSNQALQGLIAAQIQLEDSVAATPAPVVTLTGISGGVSVTIEYTESTSNQAVTLGFSVTE